MMTSLLLAHPHHAVTAVVVTDLPSRRQASGNVAESAGQLPVEGGHAGKTLLPLASPSTPFLSPSYCAAISVQASLYNCNLK